MSGEGRCEPYGLEGGGARSILPLRRWEVPEHFMARLRQAIAAAGLFKIGVATTAARMGVHDLLIQNLGRWQSAASMLYVRTSAACS